MFNQYNKREYCISNVSLDWHRSTQIFGRMVDENASQVQAGPGHTVHDCEHIWPCTRCDASTKGLSRTAGNYMSLDCM